MVSIQNEIGTRYKFAVFEPIKGQDRVACQYTLRFPCWSARCAEALCRTKMPRKVLNSKTKLGTKNPKIRLQKEYG